MTQPIENTIAPAPAQAQDEDASIMSGLAALMAERDESEQAAEAAPEETPTDATESDETPEAEADAEDADSTDDESEGDEPEPVEAEPADEPALDPATQRKLEAIQREEKKASTALAELRSERQAFEQDRAQVAKQLAEFNDLRSKARHNPAAVLSALGLSAEDYEIAARQLYALSPAAANNPKTKEAALNALRERETLTRLEQLELRNQELEQRMVAQQQEAAQRQEAQRYMAALEQTVSTETAPLVSRRMAKDADRTKAQLAQVTQRLIEQTNEIPDHSDVVAALERDLVSELELLGIDPNTVIQTGTKKPTQIAGEKRAAKSLSNELSPPTKPRSEPLSEEEERAEIIRGLQSLAE